MHFKVPAPKGLANMGYSIKKMIRFVMANLVLLSSLGSCNLILLDGSYLTRKNKTEYNSVP